jgi:DNA (cytosine-5)-methyltransferase 1
MSRPLILDLFCGAGGASKGYVEAGFDVVGVDHKPQKNYPYMFFRADALDFLTVFLGGSQFAFSDRLGNHGRLITLDDVAAIHTSPPCQAYSPATAIHKGAWYEKKHPDMIKETRLLLLATNKPFIIENVPAAPLQNPVILCGSMFDGLRVYRHRGFETLGFSFVPPRPCKHVHRTGKSKGEYHTLEKSEFITCVGHNFQAKSGRIAMGIPWMTRAELSQAIPPAYTNYIGGELMRIICPGSV